MTHKATKPSGTKVLDRKSSGKQKRMRLKKISKTSAASDVSKESLKSGRSGKSTRATRENRVQNKATKSEDKSSKSKEQKIPRKCLVIRRTKPTAGIVKTELRMIVYGDAKSQAKAFEVPVLLDASQQLANKLKELENRNQLQSPETSVSISEGTLIGRTSDRTTLTETSDEAQLRRLFKRHQSFHMKRNSADSTDDDDLSTPVPPHKGRTGQSKEKVGGSREREVHRTNQLKGKFLKKQSGEQVKEESSERLSMELAKRKLGGSRDGVSREQGSKELHALHVQHASKERVSRVGGASPIDRHCSDVERCEKALFMLKKTIEKLEHKQGKCQIEQNTELIAGIRSIIWHVNEKIKCGSKPSKEMARHLAELKEKVEEAARSCSKTTNTSSAFTTDTDATFNNK